MMSLRCILAVLALLLACSVAMPVGAAETPDAALAADTNTSAVNGDIFDPDWTADVFQIASYPEGGGRTFSVRSSVKNIGASDLFGVVVCDFVISADPVFDSRYVDPKIGYRRYIGLPIGFGLSTPLETTTVTVPDSVPGGTYYVMMEIDPYNGDDEADETNNVAVAETQVTIGKSIDLQKSTFRPPTGTLPRKFEIENSVENVGPDSSGAFTTGFFISADTTFDMQDQRIGVRENTGIGPHGTTPVESTEVTIPASVPAGTYYVLMFTDCWGAVAELNEYNNVYSSAPITIPGPCDLAPSTFTPPTGTQPRSFAIPNSVSNLGPGPAQWSFKASFYISSDQAFGPTDTLVGERNFDGLSAGSVSPVENTMVTIPPSVDGGIYHLIMVVDPDNRHPEVYEQNNIIASAGTITAPTLPDLMPYNLNPTFTGRAFSITFGVKNIGASDAGPFTVGFYLSTDAEITTQDAPIFLKRYANGVAAGTLYPQTDQVSGTVPSTVHGGEYYVGMIVDIDDQVVESIETNAAAWWLPYIGAVKQTIPGMPDLWIADFKGGYGTRPDRTFPMWGTIRNVGDANAGAFTAGIYLSSEGEITTEDYLVRTLTFASLPWTPGANDIVIPETTVRVPASVPAGTYRVGLIVDKDGAVTEYDEANNVSGYHVQFPHLGVITIGDTPNLAVSTFAPPSGAVERAFTIQNGVRNDGGIAAGPFTAGFYVSPDTTITTADTLIGSRAFTGLEAGVTAPNEATTVTIPTSVPGGTYYLGMIVDPANAVAESDEANNVSCDPDTITIAALLPDLVTRTYIPPTGSIPRDFTIENAVQNIGEGRAEVFAAYFYLSTDATITAADTLIGYRPYSSGLDAGVTAPNEDTAVTIPITVPAGTYYLGMIIDSGNYVAESNENNNLYTTSSTVTAPPPDYVFVTKWGTEGTGNGQFKSVTGIAVDTAGYVYVADWNNNRVQKFNSSGGYVTKWGSPGSGDGEFTHPFGIAVDTAGNVYVADTENNRIQKFTSTGTFVTKWGSPGSGEGQFTHPYGIAVDTAGNVYVVDSWNHRIQKFTSAGAFVTKWGTPPGSGDGQFNLPRGIAVDTAGNVYVTDSQNYRVQKFAPAVPPTTLAVTGISPGSATAGTSATYTVTGTGFATDTEVSVQGGTGGTTTVLATGESVTGTTSISCTLTIPSNAHLGPYYVSVRNPGGDWVRSANAFLTVTAVSPVQVPSGSSTPTDMDADGKYDDVNGNGRSDFADVVLYFNQMAWIAANEPVPAFDFNGNGRIDFADVVWLFNHL